MDLGLVGGHTMRDGEDGGRKMRDEMDTLVPGCWW